MTEGTEKSIAVEESAIDADAPPGRMVGGVARHIFFTSAALRELLAPASRDLYYLEALAYCSYMYLPFLVSLDHFSTAGVRKLRGRSAHTVCYLLNGDAGWG
jgi:hypothetical protein